MELLGQRVYAFAVFRDITGTSLYTHKQYMRQYMRLPISLWLHQALLKIIIMLCEYSEMGSYTLLVELHTGTFLGKICITSLKTCKPSDKTISLLGNLFYGNN